MTATVLLTISCPAIGLIVGYYCLTERYFDWKSGVMCIALFMSAIAYSYHPTEPSDIVRYIEYAQNISKLSLPEALTNSIHVDENLWVFSLVCWLIGKTGLFHLIPALSVFLVYYVSLSIMGKLGEDLKADRNEITLFIFFIILTTSLFSIVNNVRNVLSFVLVSYGIFRDVYEEKRNVGTLLCYVLPIFIHPSAIVIVLCRFIVPVIGRFKVAGLAMCIFIKPIIDSLYQITSSMVSGSIAAQVIKEPVRKAYIYFHDDHSSWGTTAQKSGSIRTAKMLHTILIIIICIYAIRYTRYLKKRIAEHCDDKRDHKLIFLTDFCFVIGLMGLASVPMLTPSYWRFAATLFLLSSPVYLSIDIVKKNSAGNDRAVIVTFDLLKKLMFVIMAACCALWVRDFRNSELLNLFLEPIASSPIVLFFRFLFEKIVFYL